MAIHVLLGIAAGIVSALLFAAAGTGSVPAVLLMYLAPLPVLIVALGWHQLVGLLALAAGGVTASLALRPTAGIAYAVGPALSAWLLAYLAAMRWGEPGAAGRTGGAPAGDGWLPAGFLLVSVALVAAALAWCSLAAVTGGEYERYREALQQVVSGLIRREARSGRSALPPGLGAAGSDFVRLVVATAPALLASMLTLILVVNLWLAAKAVSISARLPRPWPDVPTTRMPLAALGALAAGGAAWQLPGFAGVAGATLFGALGMAFALQGLALLHEATRNRPGRGIALSLAYFLSIVLGYVFLPVFALLGMADTAFPLRRALVSGQGPPGPPPSPPRT